MKIYFHTLWTNCSIMLNELNGGFFSQNFSLVWEHFFSFMIKLNRYVFFDNEKGSGRIPNPLSITYILVEGIDQLFEGLRWGCCQLLLKKLLRLYDLGYIKHEKGGASYIVLKPATSHFMHQLFAFFIKFHKVRNS